MQLFSQHISKLCYLSLVGLTFFSCSQPAKHDLSYTWSPVEISSEIEDSENIEALIAPYRVKLDSIMDEEIGYALHDLNTKGQYESTLGTFVTRLLLEQSIAHFDQKVDAAIMNHHGGLRAPINKGPIKLGEVFEVMPFENETLLLEIPGDRLTEVIEYIGKSGRSMIWPVSFDVDDFEAQNIKIAGKKIDPDKNYILSVSDYLANGGSGFKMLKSLKRLDTQPIKIRDMIVNEIRQQTARGDSIQIEVANLITLSNPQ